MKPTQTARLRRHVSSSNLITTDATLLAGCGMLGACGGSNDDNNVPDSTKSAFTGKVTTNQHNGVSDDLPAIGLGANGLAPTTALATVNPTAPMAAELRRLATCANYRALVDAVAEGGYDTLYGPGIDVSGSVMQDPGMIPSTEYMAYSGDGAGWQNVMSFVQIPGSFDVNNPCIITATSSGLRGIYGATLAGE